MPSSARIVPSIQTSRLEDLGKSPSGPLFLHMVKLEAKVQTRAVQNVSGKMLNRRTGNLASSIHPSTEIRGSKLVGAITADAEYALALHEGTKEYDIEPVRAKVLRWEAPGGGVVYAMRAHHPATEGRPFLVDALEAIKT